MYNTLWRAGYDTIGQLLNTTSAELKAIRGIGPVSALEIRELLDVYGWSLKDQNSEGADIDEVEQQGV